MMRTNTSSSCEATEGHYRGLSFHTCHCEMGRIKRWLPVHATGRQDRADSRRADLGGTRRQRSVKHRQCGGYLNPGPFRQPDPAPVPRQSPQPRQMLRRPVPRLPPILDDRKDIRPHAHTCRNTIFTSKDNDCRRVYSRSARSFASGSSLVASRIWANPVNSGLMLCHSSGTSIDHRNPTRISEGYAGNFFFTG